MKKTNAHGATQAPLDAVTLAEVRQLSRDIKDTLSEMIAHVQSERDDLSPKLFLTKLNDLQAVYLRVLAVEQAFDAKTGESDAESVDYAAIRAEIGRRLDRIRDS